MSIAMWRSRRKKNAPEKWYLKEQDMALPLMDRAMLKIAGSTPAIAILTKDGV